MPLVEPAREPATHVRSVLEHSIVKPIAEGMREPDQLDKVLAYGEVCTLLEPKRLYRSMLSISLLCSVICCWHHPFFCPSMIRVRSLSFASRTAV